MTTHTATRDPFYVPGPADPLEALLAGPAVVEPEYDPTDVPEHPAHDCHVEALEQATYPTRSGAFTVTTTCGVCGRYLGTVHDSVL